MSEAQQVPTENQAVLSLEGTGKIEEFHRLLKKWNKTHSLTRLDSENDFADAIADSLYPLNFLGDFKNCLDIGSGCGFPALALAVARPDTAFTLCEPLAKKYAFLSFAAIELGLQNVTVKKSRVEALPNEEFELVTSRAVGNSLDLVNISNRLLQKGGRWLFFKGELSCTEISGDNVEIFTKQKRKYILIRKIGC